jgi:hypothetical protein
MQTLPAKDRLYTIAQDAERSGSACLGAFAGDQGDCGSEKQRQTAELNKPEINKPEFQKSLDSTGRTSKPPGGHVG